MSALNFLNNAEQRILLWVNQNPTEGFATQTINVNTNYDIYDIIFTGYGATAATYKITVRLDEQAGIATFITGGTGQTDGAYFVFKRTFSREQNGILFNDLYASTSAGTWSRYNANTGLIPYKIYGINF